MMVVTSLRAIQLKFAEEEYVCTDGSSEAVVEVAQAYTQGTFITMGLEIEETQCVYQVWLFVFGADWFNRRRLAVDVRALKDPSPTQKLAFTKRRTTLLRRIRQFREIQQVYMPLVWGVLTAAQQEMYNRAIDQVPEATRLFMPSEISDSTIRRTVCVRGLPIFASGATGPGRSWNMGGAPARAERR
jgi:hypothetical protein